MQREKGVTYLSAAIFNYIGQATEYHLLFL